jgi:hypothetical protein
VQFYVPILTINFVTHNNILWQYYVPNLTINFVTHNNILWQFYADNFTHVFWNLKLGFIAIFGSQFTISSATHNNVFFLWQFCAANVTINCATGAKQFLYRNILGGWVGFSWVLFFLSFFFFIAWETYENSFLF